MKNSAWRVVCGPAMVLKKEVSFDVLGRQQHQSLIEGQLPKNNGKEY
jgi:hypothetical protein